MSQATRYLKKTYCIKLQPFEEILSEEVCLLPDDPKKFNDILDLWRKALNPQTKITLTKITLSKKYYLVEAAE
jgi:hypothetical protein